MDISRVFARCTHNSCARNARILFRKLLIVSALVELHEIRLVNITCHVLTAEARSIERLREG